MRSMGEAMKAAASATALALTLFVGIGAAVAAGPGKVLPDVQGADAVLYEVTENMYLLDAAGNVVTPAQAVSRKADASLYGWARVGNPLCPFEVLITNPRTGTCSVTAAGMDNLSLATFAGGVDGTFAVVVQDDNGTDAPEYVVMNGAFAGQMDLSRRPLGKIAGTFTSSASGTPTPFCGVVRLPFSVVKGKRENPVRNGTAYYLGNDGKSLLQIQRSEMSLGVPTVRFELSFSGNCASF